jgi:Fe-S cluster assembly scaffold protein SufB
MSDFEAILKAYERAGGDPSFLESRKVASLVISGNQVLGANAVPGLSVDPEPLADGVKVTLRLDPDARIENPVHLCFGVVPERGVQRILVDFDIGERASVEFTAHCTFPNAVEVEHIMDGTIHVGAGATMRYAETHYHGEKGGVRVVPKARVTVDEGARYVSTFNQKQGRAGKIEFDYEVDVGAGGVAELNARAMGFGDDDITIKETIRLNGEGARGVAKSRLALRDRAQGKVFGTTEGNAPHTRGHVDCVEIVRDEAVADAIPVVRVTDHRAKVTHEAAIGTVDKKELETLMTRGLEEEAAVDIIVQGMLEA